jgi:hypothetical protein
MPDLTHDVLDALHDKMKVSSAIGPALAESLNGRLVSGRLPTADQVVDLVRSTLRAPT